MNAMNCLFLVVLICCCGHNGRRSMCDRCDRMDRRMDCDRDRDDRMKRDCDCGRDDRMERRMDNDRDCPCQDSVPGMNDSMTRPYMGYHNN